MLSKLPAGLFGLLLAAMAIVLTPRVAALMPLFTDKSLQSTVRIDLRKLQNQQGWLLSDMLVEAVTPRTFRFVYRPHFRGRAQEQCYVFYYVSSHVGLCAGR